MLYMGLKWWVGSWGSLHSCPLIRRIRYGVLYMGLKWWVGSWGSSHSYPPSYTEDQVQRAVRGFEVVGRELGVIA